jgi:hypothetical protein
MSWNTLYTLTDSSRVQLNGLASHILNTLWMSADSTRVHLNGLRSHVLEHPVYEYGQR